MQWDLNDKKAPLEDYISEYKIKKIGNKYFTVDNRWNAEFEIVSGFQKNGFNGGEKAYLSKQYIYDEEEFLDLERKLEANFHWSTCKKLSLDQLRRINKIVEE